MSTTTTTSNAAIQYRVSSPLVLAWLKEEPNKALYLRRGQMESLLHAVGLARSAVDTLFPTGHEAKIKFAGMTYWNYDREKVLIALGVIEST